MKWRWRVIQAWVVLVLVRIGLWLLPFSIWRRWLTPMTQPKPNAQSHPDNVLTGRAVQRASRCVPGGTCLVRAIAAYLLLVRRGRQPRLWLGVALSRQFDAHAWIEEGGQVIVGGEVDLANYTPLPELPQRGF